MFVAIADGQFSTLALKKVSPAEARGNWLQRLTICLPEKSPFALGV
jgi:hypothetical protein